MALSSEVCSLLHPLLPNSVFVVVGSSQQDEGPFHEECKKTMCKSARWRENTVLHSKYSSTRGPSMSLCCEQCTKAASILPEHSTSPSWGTGLAGYRDTKKIGGSNL